MRKARNPSSTTSGGGAAAGMRVIVPLQGLVQGSGGLVLGSVIPCALFYFLQLYLKTRGRGDPPPPEVEAPQPSAGLHRVHSRLLLSPRGGATVSSRANAIVRQRDFEGLKQAEEDVFDEVENPNGVIHLCSAENRVKWIVVSRAVFLFRGVCVIDTDLWTKTDQFSLCSCVAVVGHGSMLVCGSYEYDTIGNWWRTEHKWDHLVPTI
ncbi:hypothetical protein SASPL_130975 [Salvia splendens]|uniref:Uncharacterized protein n=1 Tax=Salvia splendens TaxID=180675 RepID=A0A8X8X893_SALSN|nr:hypothetical protein SASPL_130975 [Salvia splendens]